MVTLNDGLVSANANPQATHARAKQLRIALVGKAGAGKDWFATYLSGQMTTLRAAYADALKRDIAELLLGQCVDPIGKINLLKNDPAVRTLLQAYGEAMVALNGETYWAERCKRETYGKYFYGLELPDCPRAIVITDCRKLPEAEHARRDGFVIVRIVRTDGYQAAGITAENSQHRSETEQDQIKADYTIINTGNPDSSGQVIDNLLYILQSGGREYAAVSR